MERSYFSAVSRTLTVTEAFVKNLQDIDSDEFKYYARLMETIPGLQVVRRTHKSPRTYTTKEGETFNCNPGKNLSYENMENFIAGLPTSAQYMKEYKFLKERAGKVQTSRHNLVKKWFLAQFPAFRTNPLTYIYHAPTPINAEQFAAKISAEQETKVS